MHFICAYSINFLEYILKNYDIIHERALLDFYKKQNVMPCSGRIRYKGILNH